MGGPGGPPAETDLNVLAECIQAAMDCHQSCTTCADACLGGPKVEQMRHCIRLNLDCADVCSATGRVAGRLTDTDWSVLRAQLQACVDACRACAEECEKHSEMHEHCRICAEACRACAEACEALAGAVAA